MPINHIYINKCLEHINNFIYLAKYMQNFTDVSPKHTAALRRASMELTRSLADLRKSKRKITDEEIRYTTQFISDDNFKPGDKVLICKYNIYNDNKNNCNISGIFITKDNNNKYYPYLVTYKNVYNDTIVDWVYKIKKE